MSVFKKISAAVIGVLITLAVIIFCLLFTAPGNQFIAYSANKMVDGFHIEIKKGRFLYNNPFNVSFKNQSTDSAENYRPLSFLRKNGTGRFSLGI